MEPTLVQPPDTPGSKKPSVDPLGDAGSPIQQNEQQEHIRPPKVGETNEVHATSTKREGLRSILTTVGILILAPIIALLLTAFVFQSYQVDGQSMETTLQHADRLIVFKLPKTWSKFTNNAYTPNRGDVVIFNKENLYEFDTSGQKKQLVKRVIALPGERVVVKDNKVVVYNAENPEGFEPDKTLPYGKVITDTTGSVDITVGDEQVFVMGDNRSNSLDSRVFGPISDEDIVGKLVIRIFPFNKLKNF